MNSKAKMKFYLSCQNCNVQYHTIKDFKAHVRSCRHKKAVSHIFQTAMHEGPVFLPVIVVLDYLRDPSPRDPIIGLDMVTLCITPEKFGSFYLCHVCGERLSSQKVVEHLCHDDHYFKYLSYSNPELLPFSWFEKRLCHLQSSAKIEHSTRGSGTMRVLELPKVMLKKGKEMPYHNVMSMFSTHQVTECVRANQPQRKTLQAYIADPSRTKPLLGVNFLLEFFCPDSEWNCGYLCLLCRTKVSVINCIAHCISFDHIYWYMNDAHPATLESKSSYPGKSPSFDQKILYLANEAQKEHPPGPVQSVHLDHSTFKEVNTASYANALNKLQQIRRERKQSDFKPSVEPGARILYPPETHEPTVSNVPTDSSAAVVKEAEAVHRGSVDCTGGSGPSLFCVQCDETFPIICNYKRHITKPKHQEKLAKLFGPGSYSGTITELKLYNYLWSRHKKMLPSPLLIDLQLLTTLVDRWIWYPSQAVYLCHACEINVPTSASIHLTSEQHYFNVFAHSEPDLVFLGSRNLNQIKELAREKQLRQKKEAILRVCEIPTQLLRTFKNLSYKRIMAELETHNEAMSKCVDVPKRVTLQSFAKSSERKSPLVGLPYLVKYSTTQPAPKCGYLCLLCERKLPEMVIITHMLSFSHIFAYLNVAHPGSLSKDEHEQKSLIIDLAQQAEAKCAGSSLQEVEVDFGTFHELETNSFKAALNSLQLFLKQKGLEELKRSILPGSRLVPSLKKYCQKDSLQSVNQENSPTSLNTKHINTEASKGPGLISEHVDPLKTTSCGSSASTSMQSPEPLVVPTSSQLPANPQPDLVEMETEPVSSAVPPHHNQAENTEFCSVSKPLQTPDQSFSQSQSTPAQGPKKPLEAMQKLSTLKNKAQVEPRSPPSGSALWNYLKTPHREPIVGLNCVVECVTDGQPPLYLCITCTERVKENSIIKHLTSYEHLKKYLKSTPELAKKRLRKKNVRFHAFNLERAEGYGEAQILELNAEDYHHVLHAPIVTALTKLRNLLICTNTPDVSGQNTVTASSSNGSIIKNNMVVAAVKDKLPEETVMMDDSKSDPTIDPVRTSPHLWAYLSSRYRTEPVIGLDMVTEYRSSSGQNSFLCSCCKKVLATNSYVGHLISPRHRFNYMKEKHPNLVEMCNSELGLTHKISELKAKAHIVQDLEGWGHIKVVVV